MENNQVNQPCDRCGEFISSKTLPLSSGVNITPVGISGPLVAKLPVVLAQREIQIDVEAEFRLKEPFYEIKRIKKNVFLTQCRLLPRSGVIEDGVPVTGKLFISGFVRKNIEYATADCVDKKIVSGRIAHTTVDTPFTAVTEVQYVVPPIVNRRGTQREIDLLSSCSCNDCKEPIIGKSRCDLSFEDSVVFTEKPYCELEGVRIIEDDLERDPICHHNNPEVQLFNKIIEKMVIYINVKVLQLQQVTIPMAADTDNRCDVTEYYNHCK